MPVQPKIKSKEFHPQTGVQLRKGLLKDAFQYNQQYLLQHFTVDDMLFPFFVRAGKEPPQRSRPLVMGWETFLEGSNAGRFLMGAGNTLCFTDNPALQDMMDCLIDGISSCADPDGFCMAYDREDMMILERANYTRSWLTRGLLAAMRSGSKTAGETVRKFQDWFNTYPHRRKIAELHLAYQGMIADMEMAFSAVGKPEDWQRSEALYINDHWLQDLCEGKTTAIWKYPNDGSHGYELTAIIAFLQLYFLSADERYYETVQSVWQMFRDYWVHVGGSIALCEEHNGVQNYFPGSYHITSDRHTGETCCSVWWLWLNDLLLQLHPEETKYADEIERSLYNVILPAQDSDKGIRYHANLHGKKDVATADNTCCEGAGTMLLGMLPALIYHLHTEDDGLTVHLFADSQIQYSINGSPCTVSMDTDFPDNNHVCIKIHTQKPARFPLRIRIPGWVSSEIPLLCNGELISTGKPGTYVTIDRVWASDTQIEFTLTRNLTAHRYLGVATVSGFERYALMDGPILMAVTGQGQELTCPIGWAERYPSDPRSAWNRYHWVVEADPANPESFRTQLGNSLKPYYAVTNEELFTCYPLISQKSTHQAITPEESHRLGLRRNIHCGNFSIQLAGIPAGNFLMGQDEFEPCEAPAHKEHIDNPFFMGVFPVTQEQYRYVMGVNPSRYQNDTSPVEQVTWYDAKSFISKLNTLQKEVRFRLPTEKEWEYACRAGIRDTCGYSTNSLSDLSQYEWNFQQQSIYPTPSTHTVGMKLPNAWGLYDMLGNVGEWCEDIYRSYTPGEFEESGLRVVRGGSYIDIAIYCRCGTRNALEPEWENRYTGFRLAADLISE